MDSFISTAKLKQHRPVISSWAFANNSYVSEVIRVTWLFWRKWLRIRLSWRNSHKKISLSLKVRVARSLWVMRYSYYATPNGFQFNSHPADFCFVLFLYFFQA